MHLSQPNINNSSRNLINAVTKETEGRTSLSLSRSRCLILCIPSLISRRCFRLSAKKEQCGFLRPKLLAQLRRKTAAILNFKTRKRNRRLIEFITPRFHHDMGCRKKTPKITSVTTIWNDYSAICPHENSSQIIGHRRFKFKALSERGTELPLLDGLW